MISSKTALLRIQSVCLLLWFCMYVHTPLLWNRDSRMPNVFLPWKQQEVEIICFTSKMFKSRPWGSEISTYFSCLKIQRIHAFILVCTFAWEFVVCILSSIVYSTIHQCLCHLLDAFGRSWGFFNTVLRLLVDIIASQNESPLDS